MLKFIFWFLLCINAALFAYGRGYLGNFKGSEREPARMQHQVNSAKLTLMSAAEALAAPPPPAAPVAAAAPEPAPPKPELIACLDAGDFTAAEARRFDNRIASLGLAQRPARQNVVSTEITSYMVHIPPQASRAAADSKAAELQELGVGNYYVIPENTPMKWAISLGVFKSENAAKSLLAALVKQGVDGARISARSTQVTRVSYRFRDIDPAARTRLERIVAGFPAQRVRSCK